MCVCVCQGLHINLKCVFTSWWISTYVTLICIRDNFYESLYLCIFIQISFSSYQIVVRFVFFKFNFWICSFASFVCYTVISIATMTNEIAHLSLTVEFLLKTDSGYPKDTGVTLFTLATPGNPLPLATPGNPIPWQPLGIPFSTHQSAQPVSALANSRGPGTRQAEGL